MTLQKNLQIVLNKLRTVDLNDIELKAFKELSVTETELKRGELVLANSSIIDKCNLEQTLERIEKAKNK